MLKNMLKNKKKCKLCKNIRYFLILVIPLIFMIATNQEIDLPNIDLIKLLGNVVLAILILQILWRVYKDYFKKN